MDFSKLKSSSGKKSLEKLTSELTKISGNEKKEDDRFWYPSTDKVGNGYAVIRFLPPPNDEDVPFIRLFQHGFQGPGGWYIENSLTTLGKDDPVSEYNTKLWNSGIESNKEIARKQKRKLHFISNIYVITDSNNPENEGKVFLFKYGKKLFDKLKEAMEPHFEDESPINPFDLWEGANFKLKIRQVEGYRNYDRSEFDRPGPLSDDDKELEKIWKSEYSLQEFLNPSNFKTYAELQERLAKVLSEPSMPNKKQRDTESDLEEAAPPSFKSSQSPSYSVDDEDDDESIKFFEGLANK